MTGYRFKDTRYLLCTYYSYSLITQFNREHKNLEVLFTFHFDERLSINVEINLHQFVSRDRLGLIN